MNSNTNFLFQALYEQHLGEPTENNALNEAGEEDAAMGDATMPGQAQGQTNAANDPPPPPELGGDGAAQNGDQGADPMADLENFSMDPDGTNEEEEDLPEHPDGLPEPDEIGDGGTGENNLDGELNIHYNILQLSKMDRLMAKRKMYNDYQSLRTSIRAFQHVIDENEVAIDADIREYARNKATYLFTTLTDYVTYKLSYTSYEDNLQNFLMFSKALNDLMLFVNNHGNNRKNEEEAQHRAEDFISDNSKERTAARLDREAQEKDEQDLDDMSPDELGTEEEESSDVLDSLDDHLDAVSDEVEAENGETAEETPTEEEGESETNPEETSEEPESDIELGEVEDIGEPEDIDLDDLESEDIGEEPDTDIEEIEEPDNEPDDTDIDELEELPDEGPDTNIESDEIDRELEALDLEDLDIPDFDEEEEDIEGTTRREPTRNRRERKLEGEGSEDIDIPDFDIEGI